MADYRITQFPERTEVDSTDFVLMDSDNNGTNKYALARMQTAFNTAIDTEAQARTDADEAMQDSIEQLETDMDTALNTKASIDGTYPSLAVGSLLGNSVEDKVPYLFRPTGGGLSVGDREYDTLVGGTVGWNQLVADADKDFTNTTTDNKQSGFELWIGGSANSLVAYRKIVSSTGLFGCVFNISTATDSIRVIHFGITRDITLYSTDSHGFVLNHKYMFMANFEGIDYKTVGGLVAKNMMLIDLTALFGSTIADYIYSLEQATVGSGVAWFRQYFGKDYYPYSAPTLKSVEGLTAHDMVGFNQWDEEWVNAYHNSQGEQIVDSRFISCKNKIRVLPNTTYYFKSPNVDFELFEYDSNGDFIRQSSSYLKNATFTTGTNTEYIEFSSRAANALATYNHDICINLSWSGYRNGEYEPYVKHSYPLDSTWIGRGIPKLADGKLWFDGDRYLSDGTVARRFTEVNLGDLTWNYDSTNERFTAPLTGSAANKGMICSKYPYVGSFSNLTDKTCCNIFNTMVGVKDSAYTDAASFKTAMSGVMLVYELATPTEETAEPYTSPQMVDDWGTEEYVTESIVPVGHETKYPENLAEKISDLPSLPTAAGEYKLKVTVTSGKASYTWVSA